MELKIAILSDIHANREALTKVLKDMKGLGITDVYCLGDVVGYGPHPKECLAMVKNLTNTIIAGNHEQAICNPDMNMHMLNHNAQAGVTHALKQLSTDEVAFLSQLPSSLALPDHNIFLVHGSPIEPKTWKYVSTEADAKEALAATTAHLCFIGHTHVPVVFGSINGLFKVLPDVLVLDPNEQYLINVGSVGQPRDGDCRASYGIVEIGENITTFTLRRVFYDIGKTEQEIQEAGLPPFLAERLYSGS